MQNAETNFVKIIREVCREEDIELRSYSADWIFRLDKNGRHDVILGYQFGLNSASVNMLCQDKCAASELMTEFGIPNIEHVLFASPENQKFMGFPGFWRDLLKMLDKYKTVVCKPNLGTGGENVIKCSTDYELETFGTFYKLANAMHIMQPTYIIKTDGDSEENQYWLNEGMVGYSYYDDERLIGLKELI